jgi:hypothetical protein
VSSRAQVEILQPSVPEFLDVDGVIWHGRLQPSEGYSWLIIPIFETPWFELSPVCVPSGGVAGSEQLGSRLPAAQHGMMEVDVTCCNTVRFAAQVAVMSSSAQTALQVAKHTSHGVVAAAQEPSQGSNKTRFVVCHRPIVATARAGDIRVVEWLMIFSCTRL